MSNERLAVDLNDGDLVLLGSVGRGKNLEYKDSLVKRFGSDNPEDIAREVAAYIAREEMNPPQIYLAVDCRSVLVKSHFFPFRSAGKIDAALEFELDGSIPVKRDDLNVDWIYGIKADKGTFVITGCVEQDFLADLSEAFIRNGLKLKEIVEAATPVLGLLETLGTEKNKLVLDIGRERVALYSTESGVLRHRDLILQGISSSIAALQAEGETFDSAYRQLFLADFSKEELGPDEQKAASVLERLIFQIRSYIQIYNEKTGFMPELIAICGEGSEITGIDILIEKSLETRTVRLLPHELLTHFEDNYEAGNALRAYGLLNLDKGEHFNFLPEGGSDTENGIFRHLKYTLSWLGLLALCVVIYFAANLYHKSQVINQTEERIAAIVGKSIPQVRKDFSHAQRVSILNSRINELKRKLRDNSGGAGSAIEVLRVVHAAVENSLQVTLEELTLDANRLNLSGSADNFKDVETLRNQLDKNGFFSMVRIKGAAAEKKTKKVRFTLELQRKPLGE